MQKKKGKNSIKVLTLAMLLLLLSPASESISVKHLMIKLPSILLLKHPPPHPTMTLPPPNFFLTLPLQNSLRVTKVIMQGKLFQRCTHILYCRVLSMGGKVNTRRMLKPDMGSIFHMKNE